MAVLVDELREYPYVRWTIKQWCHMVSDASFEELHAFAASLGIPRERFQRDHYDLPPALRARAVESGALEVTARGWGEKELLGVCAPLNGTSAGALRTAPRPGRPF